LVFRAEGIVRIHGGGHDLIDGGVEYEPNRSMTPLFVRVRAEIYTYCPGVGCEEARYNSQETRLAGNIGHDDRYVLALGDGKRYAIEGILA
jgi:hypothetical protein